MFKSSFTIFRIVLLVLLSLCLISCGFHLRGDYLLPSWLQQVVVKSPSLVDNTLVQQLNHRFSQRGILAKASEQPIAKIVIKSAIFSEKTSKGSQNVSTSVSLTVVFDVFEREIRKVSSDVLVQGDFQYVRGQFLVGEKQKEQLKRQLYKSATKAILKQISDL